MAIRTRLTELLGIEYPIVQAGMSWASSSAPLAIAVSNAGGLGVVAAGPMYLDDLRATIRAVRVGTDRPFAVNVPLYREQSDEVLDIVLEEDVSILIASQGGPRAYIERFRNAGRICLHVVASAEHALKAEAAGVDALIAVGGEAGGHPAPDEVSTLVLTRSVVKVARVPVVAAGGIADGAGMAAMLALGADGVQFGTRFLLTHEASVHPDYKRAVLDAGIHDTALVGRGRGPVRVLRNAFSDAYAAAEARGASPEELAALFASSSLKMAALDGDIARGKVEAGQSAGLMDELLPAAEVVARLVREFDEAVERLGSFLPVKEGAVSDVLLVETRDAVRVLTMNRPEKLNALNHALTRALLDVLLDADADRDVGAIVLTGAGRAFCAGADTSEFARLTPDESELVIERAALTTRLHATFAQLAKPVVAAVRGYALGGGCGLALACDMAVASDDARFGYPEIARGIVPAVVMANLVRQVGRKTAFELVALGQHIPASRALELGMINRVVPNEALHAETMAIAEQLASADRNTMMATKRLFHRVVDLTLEQGLTAGQDANTIMRTFRKWPPL